METKDLNNLPEVPKVDTSTANGVKGSLLVQTANEKQLTKNKVFKQLFIELCPLKFDDSKVREFLTLAVQNRIDGFSPLKDDETGKEIESETECIERLIDERRANFYANNQFELNKFELTTYEALCEMIQASTLKDDVKRVLGYLPTAEMKSKYFQGDKVIIYRGEQSTNKAGENKYLFDMLKRESELTKQSFEYTYYYELREYSVTNVLLSIRFYSTFEAVNKMLSNDVAAAEKSFEDLKRAFKDCVRLMDNNPYKVIDYLCGKNGVYFNVDTLAKMMHTRNFDLDKTE